MEADAQSAAFDELLQVLGRRLKVMTIAPSVDCKSDFVGIK